MLRGVVMLRSVSIRRAVATTRSTTLLTRPQMHPLRSDLHTLLAHTLLRRLDVADRIDMTTDSVNRHFPHPPCLIGSMTSWTTRIAICNLLLALFATIAQAQQVVRITEPTAINPAEVTIAINPKNPDNMIAASFQTGMAPHPRAGSYHYVTFDGGKTWTTVSTPDPKNLTQGDDVMAFSNDGVAYHEIG